MILQVINSLRIGGAEKFVEGIATQMRLQKVPVEVLVFDRKSTAFSEELLRQGIRIRYTLSPCYFSPLNLLTFATVMLGSRYQIIHTHLTYAQLWVALASLLNVRGKKLFTTEHSAENNRRKNRWLRWPDKFIYSRYRQVFCISDTTRHALLQWLRCRNFSKFWVIPNAVNIRQIRECMNYPKQALGLVAEDRVVMMVGRMSEAKDQLTVIRAMKYLPEQYKCVLVGDGETLEAVRKAAEGDSRIIFTGARSDVPSLLKMCDIYVQSSHWEGLPTTVLEAMAVNKPVLGSDVRGITDIVPQEQLFEEGNSMQLAEMIRSMTPGRIAGIAERQNHIVERYSMRKITGDILAYYSR